VTYQQAATIVEAVAESKARQFRRIAWLDEEDIKQEVRTKCFRILHRYDPSNTADLYTFLSKCAENRLRDIRRGVLYKYNKPCSRCVFWDPEAKKAGEHDCKAFTNKMDCDKYSRHERYVHAKLSASHPISINESLVEDQTSIRRLGHKDLIEYVYANISPELTEDFKQFESANFNLSALRPKQRVVLVEALVQILEKYQEDDYD